MDFFNQTLAQARELFASMTPGARVTAALLAAVVVISLAYLFNQGTSGPDEYLFGEPQPQSQIARMTAAMAQAGIEDFEVEGNFVRVPRGQKSAAIAAIADAGELPADVNKIMSDALDKGSVFDSREVKEQRIKSARERRLSEIIGLMPWVQQAYVIYDEKDTRGLRAVRQASAAVSVMPSVGEGVNSQRVRNLKSLVSKSFGIDPNEVTITDLGGGAMYAGEMGPEDFDHPFYREKAKIEQRIRNNLTRLLSYIPGIGIEVNAIIDNVESKRIVQVKPEEQTATLSKVTSDENNRRLAGAGGGRPGFEAQGPGRPNGATSDLPQEETTSTIADSSTQNVVGSTTQETVHAGYDLKEAWASVRVPRSYVQKVYYQRMEATGQEVPDVIPDNDIQRLEDSIKQEIFNLVEHQLPKLSLGEDELKQASIVFFDDLKQELPPGPSVASNAFAMIGAYWNSIAMGGLALFSLVMLRSMVTSSGSDNSTGRLGSLQLGDNGELQAAGGMGGGSFDDDDEDSGPSKLTLKKAETLKDDLSDMVNTDPDAAAQILRNWINNAA